MNRVSIASLRIVYEAVFPADEFPEPTIALNRLLTTREDTKDLLSYATAISSNVVADGMYYETLSTQLRQVILERDLVRLSIRHNASCKTIPNGSWLQMEGRAMCVKVKK